MNQVNTPNLTPSLADGNLAQRIMAAPAANVGSSSVPSWSQLYKHILGIKEKMMSVAAELNMIYQNLVATGYDIGEPTILMNRFLTELDAAVNKLNEISLRGNPGQSYLGLARTPAESQDIILNSTEATEVFQKFMLENQLSAQAMQEFYTHLQLKIKSEERAAAANGTN